MRNLIRIWVAKYESGTLDDDVRVVDLLQQYEAKIAALELVGRQALMASISSSSLDIS